MRLFSNMLTFNRVRDGEDGKQGAMLVPEGSWDENKTYLRDQYKTPIVEHEGLFYSLNKEGMTKGGLNPKDDYANNGSKATWRLQNSYEMVIVKAIIADGGLLGDFVFWGGKMFSKQGVDGQGNFSDKYTEYPKGNFIPNYTVDAVTGEITAMKGKFGLLQIVGNMLACYSKSSKELFRLTGEKVPSVNSFSLGWSIYKPFDVYETFTHPINIDSQEPVAETFYGVLNVPFTVDKAGEYRFTDYTVAISSDPAIPNSKIIHSSRADIFLGSKRIYADIDLDNLYNDYLEFYAPEPGDYTIVLKTTIDFIQLDNSFYKVTIGMGIRGILTKVGPSETTYIGSDGLYTSFTTGEFLHYKSGEGFTIRAGNHGLRVSKQGIQKWNGSQWVTANI